MRWAGSIWDVMRWVGSIWGAMRDWLVVYMTMRMICAMYSHSQRREERSHENVIAVIS